MQGIIGDKGPQGERGPRGQAAPTLCRSGEFEKSPPYLNLNRVCTACPNGYWFDPDKVVETENGKTCKSAWVDPDNKAHTNENPCSLSSIDGEAQGKPWCETTDGSWGYCKVNPRERCAKHTECKADEYEVEAPSNSIDRTCAPLEDCVGNNQYIHKFSKPNLNRVCASCDETQWLDKSDPTSIKTLPPGHPEYGNSTSEGANCKPVFTYEGKTYNNTCVIPEDGSKPWCVTSSIGNQSKWGYCDEKETRCKTPSKCDPSKKQYQSAAFTPVSDTKCGQCGENQWLNTITKRCMNYSECNAEKGYFLKSNPATRPRECQQCPPGQYRSGNQCKSYRTCSTGHVIDVQGDKAKDHTCKECTDNTYAKDGKCKSHTLCARGTIQDRAPSSSLDRTCKSCPSGQYADRIAKSPGREAENGFCRDDSHRYPPWGWWGNGNNTEAQAYDKCKGDPTCVAFHRHANGKFQMFCSKRSGLCGKSGNGGNPFQLSSKKYMMYGKGTTCDHANDVIRTQAECSTALASLGKSTHFSWTGKTSSIPQGCTHKNHQNRGHFEKSSGGKGRGRGDLSPLCKNSHGACRVVRSTKFELDENNGCRKTTSCPSGTVKLGNAGTYHDISCKWCGGSNYYESGGTCKSKRGCRYTKSNGSETSNRICHSPVNATCKWGNYGACYGGRYGKKSSNCYKGTKKRYKVVNTPAKYGGSTNCSGSSTAHCNLTGSAAHAYCSNRWSTCHNGSRRNHYMNENCKKYGKKIDPDRWAYCGGNSYKAWCEGR